MFDVYKIRKDFPMLDGKHSMQGKPLVYLDNSATTFKPKCVLDAISKYYTEFTSNSHRGDYDLCYRVDQEVNKARESVAKFINANSNEVVFTSGTSMSINMVAFGFGVKYLTKDDEILLTEAEHASNVLPWFKVSELTGAKINYIPLDEEGRLTPDNLKRVISKKTKIVAVAHVTNVLGFVNDIKNIAKISHEYGALLVCDGAQSVPHHKTDVKDLDVDFLSFSAHKLCGPTGIGALYGKFDLLTKMEPFMTGGGMNAKFDLCGDVQFLAPPMKFEAGTQNIEGIIGFGEAVRYIMSIGIDEIEKHESSLRKYLISKLKENKNIIIYNENAEGGIITINNKKIFAQDEATFLNSQGIAVRSGQHCAKILTKRLGAPATVRISLYFYNTFEDMDAIIEALKKEDFLDAYFS